ncbi:MAG: GatB/YqeY domain-containing protein [Anaerolineales bacterium]|nr:GatB/YqeY domain-containing protein [Anaerolineales bacterium]
MHTKSELEQEMRDALRSGDELRKRLMRRVLSDIKLREVEKQAEIDDMEMLAVFQKAVKTCQETLEEATRAGRESMVKASEAEIALLETFLPEPLSLEEIETLIKAAITETRATAPEQMGAVMKVLMPKLQGRADGKTVSGMVRSLLSE